LEGDGDLDDRWSRRPLGGVDGPGSGALRFQAWKPQQADGLLGCGLAAGTVVGAAKHLQPLSIPSLQPDGDVGVAGGEDPDREGVGGWSRRCRPGAGPPAARSRLGVALAPLAGSWGGLRRRCDATESIAIADQIE